MSRVRPEDVAVIVDALGLQRVATLHDLARVLGKPSPRVAYLVMHVLQRRVPEADDLLTFVREWQARGLPAAVEDAPRPAFGVRSAKIRVSRGLVVDITDTADSRFTTGIQRVARETLRRWSSTRELEPLVWDRARRCFVAPTTEQLRRAGIGFEAGTASVVIPFGGALFLPEIAVDLARADALRVVAEHAVDHSVAIGFDCIPVTTAETAAPGMPGAFSRYLSALTRFTTVVPISAAAGVEYEGWRRMLVGAGMSGPDIRVVTLPTEGAGRADDPDGTRRKLGLGSDPVVLAVGSKEPRKNHLNLLHACELVWRRGTAFTLILVGGNAWETRRVDEMIASLRARGRRIVTLAGVDDGTVWDLYRLARFTAFCSLNEGFGLPVVESLSVGTPVLTSDFGSTRQLGEGHGAVLVDPHDAGAMALAMSRLLDDDALVDDLTRSARTVGASSWDGYAIQVRSLIERP